MTSRGVRRLIVFLAVSVTAIAIDRMWLRSVQPRDSTPTSGKASEAALRQFEVQKRFANTLTVVVILGTAWILIPRPRIRRDPGPFIR